VRVNLAPDNISIIFTQPVLNFKPFGAVAPPFIALFLLLTCAFLRKYNNGRNKGINISCGCDKKGEFLNESLWKKVSFVVMERNLWLLTKLLFTTAF
jgi:hypothetical protein